MNTHMAHKKPPISYVQEMGGSSIAGGFVFRALLALNRLKPRIITTRIAGGLLLGYNPNYTCPGLKSFALHFVQVTIAM